MWHIIYSLGRNYYLTFDDFKDFACPNAPFPLSSPIIQIECLVRKHIWENFILRVFCSQNLPGKHYVLVSSNNLLKIRTYSLTNVFVRFPFSSSSSRAFMSAGHSGKYKSKSISASCSAFPSCPSFCWVEQFDFFTFFGGSRPFFVSIREIFCSLASFSASIVHFSTLCPDCRLVRSEESCVFGSSFACNWEDRILCICSVVEVVFNVFRISFVGETGIDTPSNLTAVDQINIRTCVSVSGLLWSAVRYCVFRFI